MKEAVWSDRGKLKRLINKKDNAKLIGWFRGAAKTVRLFAG
jgi:Zn-finger nucleic acid-binding protein